MLCYHNSSSSMHTPQVCEGDERQSLATAQTEIQKKSLRLNYPLEKRVTLSANSYKRIEQPLPTLYMCVPSTVHNIHVHTCSNTGAHTCVVFQIQNTCMCNSWVSSELGGILSSLGAAWSESNWIPLGIMNHWSAHKDFIYRQIKKHQLSLKGVHNISILALTDTEHVHI